MRVKVIDTIVRLYPYVDKGRPDKRFRSGYREAPSNECRVEFEFILDNPELLLRCLFHIHIVDYGEYVVTAVNNMAKIATVKLCSTYDFKNTKCFVMPKQVEFTINGMTVSEKTTL